MSWEMKKYPVYYAGVKQRFSKCVVVGNLIFCSGASGATLETGKVPSDDMAEQMVVALDKIRGYLEEAGSSMDNVIATTIYLKDLKDYPCMRETELDYYQKHAPLLVDEPPVSTFVQPVSLAQPEYLVEVEAIAVVSKEEHGWEMRKYPLYYAGVKQVFPYVNAGMPHLSKSVVVGNLIFCSGASALALKTRKIETHDLAEQVVVALDKIRGYLEEAGSSMDNLVKTAILIKDMKDYSRMREAELDYYQKHAPLLVDKPPVSTVIQPFGLANPDYLIEIDATGVIP